MKSIRHGLFLGGCACVLVACARDGRAPALSAGAQTRVQPAPVVPACGRLHPGVGAARLGSVRAGSPVALATSTTSGGAVRTLAYVADADEPTLHTIDVDTAAEVATTTLAGRPEQVLVLADGRVAVTLRASNAIQILEPAAAAEGLASRCVVETAAEPIALAATPDDATVLVTTGWGHSLAAFDARTFTPAYEVPLPRDPRAVVVSDDGSRAFVAHVVEARMSVVDLTTPAHATRTIDLRAHTGLDAPPEASLRKGCQGFALAKVGGDGDSAQAKKMVDRVFAPMVSVSPGEVGESSGGYGSDSPSEVSEVTVVDAAAERTLTRAVVLPGNGTAQGQCLLPRAAAYSDGALYVTCLGTDALVALDARSLDPSRAELRRWKVAPGPTGVALDPSRGRAVVWSQFDRELAVIALSAPDATPVARVAVARHAEGITANVALGRKLFHQTGDTRISADGRACASCHPDGREDALTWITPEGPRQTPMLAGRVAGTGPYGWMGSSPKLEDHLKKTFERLGAEGLHDAELAALVDYVGTMTPPIDHAARTGADATAARRALVDRGHALFDSAATACSTCHDEARAFSDGAAHAVALPAVRGETESFDTPSLRFVAGTAPYFHDGRYKTLDDVLTAPDHAMGESTRLSRDDRAALVAYLETL